MATATANRSFSIVDIIELANTGELSPETLRGQALKWWKTGEKTDLKTALKAVELGLLTDEEGEKAIDTASAAPAKTTTASKGKGKGKTSPKTAPTKTTSTAKTSRFCRALKAKENARKQTYAEKNDIDGPFPTLHFLPESSEKCGRPIYLVIGSDGELAQQKAITGACALALAEMAGGSDEFIQALIDDMEGFSS